MKNQKIIDSTKSSDNILIDIGKVTVIRKDLMKNFYDYIINMPQNTPTPPFLVDINLVSANSHELAEEYNAAFKSAKYIILSRRIHLMSAYGHVYDMQNQYKFILFDDRDFPFREIRIISKEWFCNDGVISTYFGDNPITLEISERSLEKIINMN